MAVCSCSLRDKCEGEGDGVGEGRKGIVRVGGVGVGSCIAVGGWIVGIAGVAATAWGVGRLGDEMGDIGGLVALAPTE
jgi:hypothetical protein